MSNTLTGNLLASMQAPTKQLPTRQKDLSAHFPGMQRSNPAPPAADDDVGNIGAKWLNSGLDGLISGANSGRLSPQSTHDASTAS